ncbi:hypothetical protein [Shimazuella kribbensis]|uniref:hypothetical protein n=1 Tax=Shimazuella kribbensis TaxID=139808 RepID=UPI0004143D67|nr:hypothetical protein [Shimazuella kribbensis]
MSIELNLFPFVILLIILMVKKYKSGKNKKMMEVGKSVYRSGYNYSCEDGEFWSKAALEDIARFRIPVPSYPWVDWNNYAQWFLFNFLHKDVPMELEIIEHNLTIIESLTNDEAQSLYVHFRGEFKNIKKHIYRSAYLYTDENELAKTGPYIPYFIRSKYYYNNSGKYWSEDELEEIAGTRIRVPNRRIEILDENPHWFLFRYLHSGVPMELEIIEHNLTIIESLTNDEARKLYPSSHSVFYRSF